ncbi:oxygen-regulated protein 1-like [Myxocyprinus asiaticus]|uniref:oxygen-regulated protein 1-like n=1 Tax=Myxocyprinus asiaticus TaxID=70543 RepID=UPI002222BEFE|nr:oxygen-regulated protein 1-like [Myxocyprinus asiaticus]
MSTTPFYDAPQPIISKKICFYKSGDPQFTGHRMVINSRTFKTFDALLDALSKKVPLPFGVRTITTPGGTHAVCTLDDLQDGASYLCSDQRKVKPFNLDEIHKRQVPWNTTRPISAGRQARRAMVRQLVKRSEVTTRKVKMAENIVVRTPKRLTVYKNRDPSMKRVIVIQRRTAPNFKTLLDDLSQVMQFPVLKLYTEDGRKVEGLPALILCSGIVVAAGNEPFRMGNYNLQGHTKTIQSSMSESLGPTQTETLLQEKKKPTGTFSRSRNFSLSSEKFLVEQISKSLNGNLSEHNSKKTGSMETEGSQPAGSEEMQTCDCMAGIEERNYPIMPTEDDIEKSFRVNEDGSMTVEMKVNLTIKQKEIIHWTTTLSRTQVNCQQRTVCTSKPGSGVNSLDVTNDSGKESNGPHSLESKEITTLTDKSVGFNEEGRENYGSGTSQTSEKPMPIYRRLPTPGPRQRSKEASVENIKRVSETEVQESTMGSYSYLERTAQGELTEGYCMVSRSSSSSTRTVSKPKKSKSGEVKQKKSHSSFRSTGVAEVLQLQNNGTMGITDTVLHIYKSQGTYDNYYANKQVDVDNKPGYCTKALLCSRPGSTDSEPRSSSNDSDVDLARQSTSSNSREGEKTDMLLLSSVYSTPPQKISHNLSVLTDNKKQALVESESTDKKTMLPEVAMEQDSEVKSINGSKRKNTSKSKKSQKGTSSESSGPVKRVKGSTPSFSKDLQKTNTSDTLSHTGSEKKTRSSAESVKLEHKTGRDKNKKTLESSPKSRNLNPNIGHQRRSEKEIKVLDKTIRNLSNKVNTSDCDSPGPTLKKKILDIRSMAHPSPLKKMLPKQRSVNGNRSKSPKRKQEMSESVSLPVLQSSPSSVNQYVENWLKKIQPEYVPYDDETENPENVPRAVFQIGSDSADGSEIKSEPENDSVLDEGPSLEENAVERLVSRPPVQICCEGEPVEPQKLRVFCKSMPSVRVHAAEQEGLVRLHKSSENLVSSDPCIKGGTSQGAELNIRSGMKPVLEQLCLSIQSIRRASSQPCKPSQEKEKSSSLPDFSSQLASSFGSPSRAFLSFLSLMTLRDGISILGKDESQSSNSGSCPEALQVMQSLEKIANIEDEEELKASLTSLQSSTSSQLKQCWREFQKKNVIGESPPLSPRQSEQEFALQVDSGGEGEDEEKEPDFGIEQLMNELNMSENIRREISSLVEGELKSSNQTNLSKGNSDSTRDISGKEEENDACSMSGSLEKAADMEEDYFKENIGQDNHTSKDEMIDDPKEPESQDMHLIQSHSHENVETDLVHEDSCKAVPNQNLEENCSDSGTTEVLETTENTQKYTVKMEEMVMYDDLESEDSDAEENHSPTSEQKITKITGEEVSELSDDQDSMSERENKTTQENIEERDFNAEEDTIQNIRGHSEQSDVSELKDTDVKHLCSASETECVQFPDRETAEIQKQHCVRMEDDHSHLKERNEEEGHKQENKSILSECDSESHHSELCSEDYQSESHYYNKEELRQQTLESGSQENDQLMSPDFEDPKTEQQEDATPDISECEDPDPHNNYSSPGCGSNDENDEKSVYNKTQQIENGQLKEHDRNYENEEVSKVCKLVDPDAEPGSCTISDSEAVDEDVIEKESGSSTVCDSEHVCKVQALEEDSFIDKKYSSAEEHNVEKNEEGSILNAHNRLMEEYDSNNEDVEISKVCVDNKDSVERESIKCMRTKTSEHKLEEAENLGMEHGYHYLLHPTEISQELLDLINSALLSSTLTVTYDSNGNLRIEPDKCKIRKMFMAEHKADNQYGQKCLPSPNTSDLSDYRPETSDNGEYQSQASMEHSTESGEEAERLRIVQEIIKQSSHNPKSRNHVKVNRSMKSSSGTTTKHTPSSSLKSNNSLASFQDSTGVIQEPLCYNRSSSLHRDSESVQCMALNGEVDSGEGVLIDKGRWLLKENHLIRNSPPVPMGMYGNGDTTSADTAQDNASEEAPYPFCENQHSPLAVISSSELEDMAKPPTPKCTYFNMVHSSDSDPLLDAQSINSGNRRDTGKNKELRVAPMGESSKMWAKKNGSLSSFASVEFKLPDGKVHPQDEPVSGAVNANRSQRIESRTQEEESREWLNLRCGQHCPIL